MSTVLAAADTKVCTVCKRRLPIESFYRRSRSKDGRDYRCADCGRRATASSRRRWPEWRLTNAAYDRATQRLRDAHRREFERLIDEERAAAGLPMIYGYVCATPQHRCEPGGEAATSPAPGHCADTDGDAAGVTPGR